jgi:4-hydroxybenzoate polyprenyltransferase
MKILALFKLIRWKNLGIIFLTQILAIFAFLKYNDVVLINLPKIIFIVISCLCISAAGYVINDYFDVKIDQINKPAEVIVGTYISRRQALLFHQILNIIGVILGLCAGLKVLIINIFAITLLWFYASIFKKKPFVGNLIVAALLALVLIEIAWVFEPRNVKLWFYAFLVFSVNLVREIVKDMEDKDGDEAHGAHTLPVLLGYLQTKKIVYVIMLISLLIISVFCTWRSDFRFWMLGLVMTGFYGFVYFKLKNADRKSHFGYLSVALKYFLILGLISSILV